MAGTPAIETIELTKTYTTGGASVPAVRGVTLAVQPAEIYALLGPNGAGKTTTIAMLTTLLLPTSGTARLAGYDVVREPDEVRKRIGVTFQEVVLDQELSGREVLDFHGQLYGMKREHRREKIAELARLVELTDALDRKAARYSGGMKRRLELARGLMTEPQVLFLDEPTQGLDPQNRAGIWTYIRRLREEKGITLLLTTHYMDEAETLADRVGIIDGGKLVAEGRPADLVRAMGADVISVKGKGLPNHLMQRLHFMPFVQHVNHVAEPPQSNGGQSRPAEEEFTLQIGVDFGDRRLAEVVRAAVESNVHVHEIAVARPTLGDVFLSHTGRALRD